MFKISFKNIKQADALFIISLLLLSGLRFYLQQQGLYQLKGISELHPLLTIIYSLSVFNLSVFIIIALFNSNNSKAWWERKSKREEIKEKIGRVWAKSLMVSFVIFILGTISAFLLLGNMYMLFTFVLAFLVQRFSKIRLVKVYKSF